MHTLSLTRITALLTLVIALLGGASFTHALDVNRASAEELTELKGIGPKRAEAILNSRFVSMCPHRRTSFRKPFPSRG